MSGPLLKGGVLRHLPDLAFERIHILSLLLEDYIRGAERGEVVAQHPRPQPTDLADHSHERSQRLLCLSGFARQRVER
jgi:hypothetical protein